MEDIIARAIALKGKGIAEQLSNIGKYLALWNCTTGLPGTNPGTLPYTYRTGDYYIVSVIGDTNLRPSGATYDGTASTTAETGTVAVGDMYRFDGSVWEKLNFSAVLNKYVAKSDIKTSISGSSTNTDVPSGKAVYDLVKDNVIVPVITCIDNLDTSEESLSCNVSYNELRSALESHKPIIGMTYLIKIEDDDVTCCIAYIFDNIRIDFESSGEPIKFVSTISDSLSNDAYLLTRNNVLSYLGSETEYYYPYNETWTFTLSDNTTVTKIIKTGVSV